jgi:hypothetical protein
MDAGASGTRLSQRDAYAFAKGREVRTSTGQRAKLSRPLDFLVVTDHSDGMGFIPLVLAGDPVIMADPQGRKWHDMIQSGKGMEAAMDIIVSFGKGAISPAIMPVPGAGLSQRLAGHDQGGRGKQRAGPLHRGHRLRVDLKHGWRKPAPQRHLP